MQTLLQIPEIAKRLEAIRVPPTELSRRAGLNFSTYYRGLQRPELTRIGVLEEFNRALIALEIETRDYLNALHPPGVIVDAA